MPNEKPQVFIDITDDEVRERIEEYDSGGWRFVNISGNTVAGGVELIYSFSKGLPLENLRFTIDSKTVIPSISDRFPNAFFFENETHDLFGVNFSDISIDFNGEFYTVAVPTPMNPHSPSAREAAADNRYGAVNHGACAPPPSASAEEIAGEDAAQPAAGEEAAAGAQPAAGEEAAAGAESAAGEETVGQRDGRGAR
jgi:hypothetical protein